MKRTHLQLAWGGLALALMGCPNDDTTGVVDGTSTGGEDTTSTTAPTTMTTTGTSAGTGTGMSETGTETGMVDTGSDTGVADTGTETGPGATDTGMTETGAETGGVCGDDVVGGDEACDGADLAGEDCISQGFDGGTLACDAACAFDTSGCTNSQAGACCSPNGTPGCEVAACEAAVCGLDVFCCDTEWDDICADLAASEAACLGTSDCPEPGMCGNDMVEAGEDCDGADLGGQDCTTVGFGGGTLSCAADCTFDTSMCTAGGACCSPNGSPGCEVDACSASVCGADPFCCSMEWDGLCADAAALDPACQGMSDCLPAGICGDGMLGAGEACDGADLGGLDCTSLGFGGGTLSCLGDCTFDTSMCTAGGDCCAPNGSIGCEEPTCMASVCAADPFCCSVEWDGICADLALQDPVCAGASPSCPLPCVDEDIGSAVGAGVSVGTTVGDDNDLNGSCAMGDGDDRVVQFTASAPGDYTFDTIGSGFNTELSLWSDCSTELSCNDNIGMGNQQSEITTTLAQGETVLILIDGFNGATGDYVLNITAPPPDLSCSEGVGMAPSFMGTNVGEDDTFNEGCAAPGSVDSVYEYTATVAGVHTFDAIGSDYDTLLSATASCFGPELACNDDFDGNPDCGGFPCSQVSVDMTVGQTILLSIAGFDGATGNWVINVTEPI